MASFADQLKGKVVKHHSDNQNVVRVLFNGSKKQALHKVVLSIFNLCIDNKINLLPEWVPRDDNVIADLASKSIDRDDFMLHPDIFVALDILWGPHTIDRFSSFRSKQLPRFKRNNNLIFVHLHENHFLTWSRKKKKKRVNKIFALEFSQSLISMPNTFGKLCVGGWER